MEYNESRNGIIDRFKKFKLSRCFSKCSNVSGFVFILIKLPMSNNILIEDQYNRTSLFEKENVNYLVRVLKRFNTVPKINNINIITSTTEPSVFKIVPNKSIIIGK